MKTSVVRRYSSTLKFTVHHMETAEVTFCAAQNSAATDVWVCFICFNIRLGDIGAVRILNTRDILILIARDASRLNWHNSWYFQCEESPGYFRILTGSRALTQVVCDSYQNVFSNAMKVFERLEDNMFMREITIPPYSMFIGHGYVQHA